MCQITVVAGRGSIWAPSRHGRYHRLADRAPRHRRRSSGCPPRRAPPRTTGAPQRGDGCDGRDRRSLGTSFGRPARSAATDCPRCLPGGERRRSGCRGLPGRRSLLGVRARLSVWAAIGARRLGRGPKARLRFSFDEVDALLAPCHRGRESTSADSARSAGRPPRRRRRLGTTAPLLPVRGVNLRRSMTDHATPALRTTADQAAGLPPTGFVPAGRGTPAAAGDEVVEVRHALVAGRGWRGEAARDRRSPGASERGGLPSSSRLRTTFGATAGPCRPADSGH